MVTKNFKRWLGVGVEGWLILQLLDTDLFVKFGDDAHELAQANISISNHTLTLMELSQMSRVERLISENTIDREVFHGFELLLLGELV